MLLDFTLRLMRMMSTVKQRLPDSKYDASTPVR